MGCILYALSYNLLAQETCIEQRVLVRAIAAFGMPVLGIPRFRRLQRGDMSSSNGPQAKSQTHPELIVPQALVPSFEITRLALSSPCHLESPRIDRERVGGVLAHRETFEDGKDSVTDASAALPAKHEDARWQANDEIGRGREERRLTEGNVSALAAGHVGIIRQIKSQASHSHGDLLLLCFSLVVDGPVEEVRRHVGIVQVLVNPIAAPAALFAHGQQRFAIGFAGAAVLQWCESHV